MSISEITGHIRQLDRLSKTVSTGLCDSGSGTCKMAFELRASEPALQAAIRALRKERRRLAPIMDQEDAELEP